MKGDDDDDDDERIAFNVASNYSPNPRHVTVKENHIAIV